MRAFELDTKFHHRKRSPSSGAPPTSITRAGRSARSRRTRPGASDSMCCAGTGVSSTVDVALDRVHRALDVLVRHLERRCPPAASSAT